MDTTVEQGYEKRALSVSDALSTLGLVRSTTVDGLKAYLAYAATVGLIGGAGAGLAASHVKSKNPKLLSLDRQKKFYDSKIDEIQNENWLNDLMLTKKKLESSRLSDEERSELEKSYVKMINSGK